MGVASRNSSGEKISRPGHANKAVEAGVHTSFVNSSINCAPTEDALAQHPTGSASSRNLNKKRTNTVSGFFSTGVCLNLVIRTVGTTYDNSRDYKFVHLTIIRQISVVGSSLRGPWVDCEVRFPRKPFARFAPNSTNVLPRT